MWLKRLLFIFTICSLGACEDCGSSGSDIDPDPSINPVQNNNCDAKCVYAVALDETDRYELQIFNISNPSAPSLSATTYDIPGSGDGYAMAGNGNNTYLADSYGGLQILDSTDCLSPILVGSYETDFGSAYVITFSGNYAYVIGFSEIDERCSMDVIDISDSSAPTLTNTLSAERCPNDITANGNYLYAIDNQQGSSPYSWTSWLDIYDITVPSNPIRAGSYDFSGPFDDAYSYAESVAVSGNYAYVATRQVLMIIDISNPSSPTLAASYDTSNVRDIAVNGNYAYFMDGNTGLTILDVTNPSVPTLAGTFDNPGGFNIAVNSCYAYISNNEVDLHIVDISNPADPTLVGSYNTVVESYSD